MGINKKGASVAPRAYKRIVKANTKRFIKARIVKPARIANRVQRVEATVIRTAGRLIASGRFPRPGTLYCNRRCAM